MEIAELEDVLKSQETFRTLPAHELAQLAQHFSLLVFRLGDVILQTTNPDRALYVVYAGRARLVEERHDADPVTLPCSPGVRPSANTRCRVRPARIR